MFFTSEILQNSVQACHTIVIQAQWGRCLPFLAECQKVAAKASRTRCLNTEQKNWKNNLRKLLQWLHVV